LLGGVALALSGSAALLRDGVATTGTVTALDVEGVTFSFDAEGERRTETLEIVSGTDYALGDPVEVRYDADDPGVARLVDEPRRIAGLGPAVVVLGLAAFGAAVLGAGAVTRALRWRRALSRAPWLLARLRMKGIDVALTPSGADPILGRLRSTSRWRTKTLLDLDGHELWLVVDGRELVLRVDGLDTLFGARRRD
ncbi:MAG: hypothetical protein H0T85_07375, partial [Geodermatophilaceae bacterium]|nr:hypothetical protein [Geodermatophilaceae bacterium]